MPFRKLVSGTFVAAIDQAWLSGLNFVIGLAFIHGTTRIEYGRYAMLFNGILLAQSIQNALITSPMTTVIPMREGAIRSQLMSDVRKAQAVLSVLLPLLGAVFVWAAFAIRSRAGEPAWPALPFGVAVLGVLLREFLRSVCFLEGVPARALATDVAYGVLLLSAVAYLLAAGQWDASAALLAMGVAAVAATACGLRRRGSATEVNTVRAAGRGMRELWPYARWALPSVLVTWGYMNAYVYVVGAQMGAAAVGDLSAGRLLLVPLSMMFVAWTSMFRPRASRWVALGELPTLNGYVRHSLVAVLGVVCGYGLVLFTLYPIIQPLLLGEKYARLEPVVTAWLAFFTVNGIRTVGMACMLTADRGYRAMYYYGWVAFLTSVPLVLLAGVLASPVGVVLALCMAEAVLAALIWFRGWPRMHSFRGAAP
ncbi:MAG: hypothetical protein OHK0018_15480 [Erythrobacter tepidarius]